MLRADFCKNLGLIEKYGSGIRRVVDYFSRENLPVPSFQNVSDGFMVTVFGNKASSENVNVPENVPKNVPKNVPENVPDGVPEKRLAFILSFMKIEPGITVEQLAKRSGVTVKTIKRDLEKLKAQALVKRIGPAKGGYWEVLDKA